MLNLLQLWQPSQEQPDQFQQGMVISDADTPSDADITGTYDDHPDADFLTVFRASYPTHQQCPDSSPVQLLTSIGQHPL